MSFIRAFQLHQDETQLGLGLQRIGREFNRYFYFRERLVKMIALGQQLRLGDVIQSGGQRNFEVSVENEDALLDHRRGTKPLKLIVRIQRAGSKLISRKHSRADEHGPSRLAGTSIEGCSQTEAMVVSGLHGMP